MYLQIKPAELCMLLQQNNPRFEGLGVTTQQPGCADQSFIQSIDARNALRIF